MSYVKLSNHIRVAGRQVDFVNYAGGRMLFAQKDAELGNFARPTHRAYAQRQLVDNGITM